MFVVQIPGDIFFDDVPAFVDHFGEHDLLFRCYLESDMEKLAQVQIAGFARHIVMQCQNKLLGTPGRHLRGRGESVFVDIYHREIRFAQIVASPVGLLVYFFCKLQSGAPGSCKSGKLFKPRGPRRFKVNARIHVLDRTVHDGIKRKLVAAGVNAQLQIAGEVEITP